MTNFYHNRITGLDAIHPPMWVTSTDPALDTDNDVQPGQFWLDTTGGATLEAGAILKERDAGNTSWTTRADIKTALDLKANLASPTFTGTPAAPTAAGGTNTTQIATTAFVAAAVSAGGVVSSVFGRTGAVVKASGDYLVADVTGAAPLASPALTGTPTVPTAAPGTNTTQAASTAFVAAAVAAGSVGALDDISDVDASSPSDGDVLTYDSGSGDWVPSAPVGGSARAVVNLVTGSLADGATENSTVTLAKTSIILQLTADRACWIRLYQTSADRTADNARLIGTEVPVTTDILAEWAFAGSGTRRRIPVTVTNGDGSPTTDIYYAIQNRSGATHTVAVDITHLPLET
jgi:hypothetical protein